MTAGPDPAPGYSGFPRRPGGIPELDGLRAIAVLLVLARHIARPVQERDPGLLVAFGYDFATPLLNGWVGVDLFFVLSGFLISRHLLARRRQGRALAFGPYLTARALRILPAYLAVLGLVLAGAFPFYAPEPDMRSVLVHLAILQDYLGSDIVVAFWSLGVEEKFYLCAPFLVWAAARMRGGRRYALLGALVLLPTLLRGATFALGPEVDTYQALFERFRSPFHLTFDGLAAGVFVAFLQADGLLRRLGSGPRRTILAASLGLVSLLMLHAPMMARIGPFDATVQPLLIALGMGGVLLALLDRDAPPGWLGARPLFVVAVLSYTLYLVHMPLIPLATVVSVAVTGEADPLVFAAGTLAFSALAALAVHFAVEKPFLILKERHALRGRWRVRTDGPLRQGRLRQP